MNLKKETIEHIGNMDVKYIRVIQQKGLYDKKVYEGTLNEVINKLDFYYDNGYGSKEIEGYIWYTDNSWSERFEYDGAEWWEYKSCPEI